MIDIFNNKHSEILKSLMWRSLQIGSKYGILLLIFILAAKYLSPYDFGVYNYLLAVAFFLIIIGDFGISFAASRYVAEYDSLDREKMKLVFFNSFILIFFISLILILFVLLFGKFLFGSEVYNLLIYLLPLSFIGPMTSLYDGLYRGLKKFRELAIFSLVPAVISLVISFFLIIKYGLVGALLSQIVFYSLLFLFLSFGYKHYSFDFNKTILSKIASYSLVIGVASLGYYFYTQFDLVILGKFGYIEEIGMYEIVNKLLLFTIIPFSIFAHVISPDITKKWTEKKTNFIISKFKKYLLLAVIFSFISVVSLYFLFPLLLKLFLPHYFNPLMIRIFNLMLFVYFTQISTSIISVGFVYPTGYAKLSMYFLIIFGLLNVILDLVLVNFFGFIGVIYSTVILKIVADILFTLVYYTKLKKIKYM